ncbi:hypothetical protein SLEP1_g16044 [Rubroshorea leprosula]|uniref:Uncharacterized protein n=1 Tax=Rubroshorea leprosula TaxID=152421 RepID=A0AAV5IX68_9ROSI|nr:hypothetical protein SLEP1_g16044 [Rubroshorea leprosula]
MRERNGSIILSCSIDLTTMFFISSPIVNAQKKSRVLPPRDVKWFLIGSETF